MVAVEAEDAEGFGVPNAATATTPPTRRGPPASERRYNFGIAVIWMRLAVVRRDDGTDSDAARISATSVQSSVVSCRIRDDSVAGV